MTYEGNIFRPPSEAGSLLLQVTVGCSHNQCTFCSMYKDKTFRIKSLSEIHDNLKNCKENYPYPVQRVFLCDGNALIMKTEDLKQILTWIKAYFPNCKRVGSYAQPLDILRKTSEELTELQSLGLDILYIGLESGSDAVLKMVKKGVTKEQMIQMSDLLRQTKIKTSIMVITGLGGQEYWEVHAKETADALNQIQPHYLGLLALMVNPGTKLNEDIQNNNFQLLTPNQVVQEMQHMVQSLELENCFFSSVHASNYINLKGKLPEDKNRLMQELNFYLLNESAYRSETYRGL